MKPRNIVLALLLAVLVAWAGLTAAGASTAQAPKPKAHAYYICGGEGEVLCLSNSKTKAPHGAEVDICFFTNTPCRLADHIWRRELGRVGYDHFDPFRWPGDRKFFHGEYVYRYYWMKYSPHAHAFGPTVYCMVPHPGQVNGARIILESCKKPGSLGTRSMWAEFPLTKLGYVTLNAIGIASVFEANAHGHGHPLPWVMTNLFNDHEGLRGTYLLEAAHNDAQKQFHQAWFFERASVH